MREVPCLTADPDGGGEGFDESHTDWLLGYIDALQELGISLPH